MADYEPIKLRAFYRSPSHLHIWEILDKAGVQSISMEYCTLPSERRSPLHPSPRS